MTILIVDDHAGFRRLIRRALADVAAEIAECFDGSEALAAYTAHQPSLVLMDIRMPQMDGLTATRQITNVNPSARIVILTDYDDDDIRQSAQEAGACAYALKGDLLDLRNLVSRMTAG